MISGHSSVASVLPGNPVAISSVLDTVGAAVGPAKAVGSAWQAMGLSGWSGRAATQWAAFAPREATRNGQAPAAFGRVAAAMLAYQSAFLVARSEIEAAIRDAAAAEQATANARQTHREATRRAALAEPGTAEATVAAFRDPGATALAGAQARAGAAQAVFARHAEAAAAEIRSAAGQTTNEKPGIEWWDQVLQFPGRFVEGFILQGVDTVVGLWELVDLPGLFDAMGKGIDPSMFYAIKGATIAYAIAQDPGAAFEGVVREFFAADHWDGYAGEGVGRVGFNILSLFSGGAGAVRGLKFLKDLKAPKPSVIAGPGAKLFPKDFDPWGGLGKNEFFEKHWDPNKVNRDGSHGAWKYPPDDGFDSSPGAVPRTVVKDMEVGTTFDRFGGTGGGYVSPEGTPFPQRALPPDSVTKDYHVYELLKPFDSKSGFPEVGSIAKAFEQPGGGIQIKLPKSVQWLLDNDYIGEVAR